MIEKWEFWLFSFSPLYVLVVLVSSFNIHGKPSDIIGWHFYCSRHSNGCYMGGTNTSPTTSLVGRSRILTCFVAIQASILRIWGFCGDIIIYLFSHLKNGSTSIDTKQENRWNIINAFVLKRNAPPFQQSSQQFSLPQVGLFWARLALSVIFTMLLKKKHCYTGWWCHRFRPPLTSKAKIRKAMQRKGGEVTLSAVVRSIAEMKHIQRPLRKPP